LTAVQAISSHALGFQLLSLLHEAGEVLGRAGRGECAGYGEQRNLAAREIGVALDLLRPVLGHFHEGCGGNLVAFGNGHGKLLGLVYDCRFQVGLSCGKSSAIRKADANWA
jgi:hypothetical protein